MLRLFAKRELRTKFVPMRKEVTGERRRLNNGEIYDLYFSLNIVQVIKERRVGWAGVWHIW
jgi:hypothetical protein